MASLKAFPTFQSVEYSQYPKHLLSRAATAPLNPIGLTQNPLVGIFQSCVLWTTLRQGAKHFGIKAITQTVSLPLAIGAYLALAVVHYGANYFIYSSAQYFQDRLLSLAKGESPSRIFILEDEVQEMKEKAEALRGLIAQERQKRPKSAPPLNRQAIFNALATRYQGILSRAEPTHSNEPSLSREEWIKNRKTEYKNDHGAFQDLIRSFIPERTTTTTTTTSASDLSPASETEGSQENTLAELSYNLIKHLSKEAPVEELEKFALHSSNFDSKLPTSRPILFLVRQIKGDPVKVLEAAESFAKSLTSDEIDTATYAVRLKVFEEFLLSLNYLAETGTEKDYFRAALQLTLEELAQKFQSKGKDSRFVESRLAPLLKVLKKELFANTLFKSKKTPQKLICFAIRSKMATSESMELFVKSNKGNADKIGFIATHFVQMITSDTLDDSTFKYYLGQTRIFLSKLKEEAVTEDEKALLQETFERIRDVIYGKFQTKSEDTAYVKSCLAPMLDLLKEQASAKILFQETATGLHLVDLALQHVDICSDLLKSILDHIQPADKKAFNETLTLIPHTLLTQMVLTPGRGDTGKFHLLLTEKLLERLDLNAEDALGNTPLIAAVKWGEATKDYRLLERLLKLKADPNVKNREGKTALHILVEGANPEQRTSFEALESAFGESKSQKRAPHFCTKALELLLKHGADIDVKDKAMMTPRDTLDKFPNLQDLILAAEKAAEHESLL